MLVHYVFGHWEIAAVQQRGVGEQVGAVGDPCCVRGCDTGELRRVDIAGRVLRAGQLQMEVGADLGVAALLFEQADGSTELFGRGLIAEPPASPGSRLLQAPDRPGQITCSSSGCPMVAEHADVHRHAALKPMLQCLSDGAVQHRERTSWDQRAQRLGQQGVGEFEQAWVFRHCS